ALALRNQVVGVGFSADGRLFCAACGDKKVRVWDRGSGELLSTMSENTGNISGAAFTTDSRWLAVAGYGTYDLWDPQTGYPITRRLATGASPYHEMIDMSADGHWLTVAGSDGSFPVADLRRMTTASPRTPAEALLWCELLSNARVNGTAVEGLTNAEWMER